MIVRRERQTGYTKSGAELHKEDVMAAFKDWKIWAFAVGQFGSISMLYGYSVFLPTIIKGTSRVSPPSQSKSFNAKLLPNNRPRQMDRSPSPSPHDPLLHHRCNLLSHRRKTFRQPPTSWTFPKWLRPYLDHWLHNPHLQGLSGRSLLRLLPNRHRALHHSRYSISVVADKPATVWQTDNRDCATAYDRELCGNHGSICTSNTSP